MSKCYAMEKITFMKMYIISFKTHIRDSRNVHFRA